MSKTIWRWRYFGVSKIGQMGVAIGPKKTLIKSWEIPKREIFHTVHGVWAMGARTARNRSSVTQRGGS